MPHIMSFADATSDERGRNFYEGRFEHSDRGMGGKIAAVKPFAGEDQQLVIGEYPVIRFPAAEVLQAVHAAYQYELDVGMF